MRRLLVITAIWSGTTCDASVPETLDLQLRGCVAISAGPVCAVAADTKLTIFASSTDSIDIDGARVVRSLEVADGQRIVLEGIEPGRAVTLRSGEWRAIIQTAPNAAPTAAHATSRAGREDLRAGRWESAVVKLLSAALRHERAGRISDAVLDHQARAYTLIYSALRLDEARDALDRADALMTTWGEVRVTQPYYRGLHALESGDYRGANVALREAASRGHALGLPALVDAAGEAEVAALAMLGSRREAMMRLEQIEQGLHDADPEACATARRINDTAWLRLIDADAASTGISPSLVSSLERATQVLTRSDCYGARLVASARVHLGLARLLAGMPGRALQTLDSTSTDVAPDVDYWRFEVLGRAHLALGALDAADRAFASAEAIAHRASMRDAEWRVRTFRGDLASKRGSDADAAGYYEAAERLLEDRSLDVAVGSGRAGFLADRRRSARRLAALLVDRDAGRAACVLRMANRRHLARAARAGRLEQLDGVTRSEWERRIGAYRRIRREAAEQHAASWDLPLDARATHDAEQERQRSRAETELEAALHLIEDGGERDLRCDTLPNAEPGERMVLIEGLGNDEYVMFVIGASTTTAHRFFSPAQTIRNRVEGLMKGPFRAQIESAARVTVLSHELDVHSFDWAGAPLATWKPVVYSMDLPRSQNDAGHVAASALVVGNPTRNLRRSAAESEAVARRLAAMDFVVHHQIGEQATVDAVLTGLRTASVFHFAGHGRTNARSAFDTHLELFGGRLTVADVLALAAAPASVVLSGCRTGAVDGRGINLAASFVLAGSDAVVASTRDVTDAEATHFGTAIYAAQGRAGETRRFDVVDAYQRAAKDAVPGWSAFRVWVR